METLTLSSIAMSALLLPQDSSQFSKPLPKRPRDDHLYDPYNEGINDEQHVSGHGRSRGVISRRSRCPLVQHGSTDGRPLDTMGTGQSIGP